MIDLQNEADIVTIMKHDPDRKLLVAGDDARGFIVPEKEILSQTKNGKQCLLVKDGVEAKVCTPVVGDSVACINDSRKLLIFPLEQVPEMTKGVGVILQKGGLADAKTFTYKEGLTWFSAGSEKCEKSLKAWKGERAQVGLLPPNGFPKSKKFSGV